MGVGSGLEGSRRAAATATTAAATARGAMLGLVHGQVAAFEVLAVPGFDDGLGFLVVVHLGEGESTRATGFTVGHDVDVLAGAASFFEGGPQGVFGDVEGEVSDVESTTHGVSVFPWSALLDLSSGKVFRNADHLVSILSVMRGPPWAARVAACPTW